MKKNIFLTFLILWCCNTLAQTDSTVYFKFATAQNRAAFYKNLVSNSITKNLSFPLNSTTEDKWQNAFSAIELINYQQPWVNATIKLAVDDMQNRSNDFQQALLEMLYAGSHKEYGTQANRLFGNTTNAKIFAMCAEYLLAIDSTKKNIDCILQATEKKIRQFQEDKDMAIMLELLRHVKELHTKNKYAAKSILHSLFAKNYLKGSVVVYSIQRKSRNYPGITIVKDTAGNFVMYPDGKIFSVPQLARSVSNMACYISNGNTPQGIFRLYGFDHSRSYFIGPTENIQLTMPYETSPAHFLKDSTLTDTTWSKQFYARLLPKPLKNYEPLYQTLYAGAAGRTEIIAHGTTVDPDFYKGQLYYPYTPTAGCLCTKEIWDANGIRIISDQQKLADAVKNAGGADGYLIVLELDDEQKPITPEEILPYLQ
jgi:hypothetical protein